MTRMAMTALVALLLWPALLVAAVPTTVAIEGRLQTSGGAPVADGQYAVTFSLYASQTAQQAVWSEAVGALTVKGGQFSYALGTSKPLSAAVLDAAQAAWLGLRVGNEPELARGPLHSAPYAVRAAVADAVSCTGCVSLSALKADGDLDLGGNAVKAKQITAVDVKAGTVVAQSFVGDGSGLTGLKLPTGTCPQGQVVLGVANDGKLVCGAAGGAAGGTLEQVSGGLLTTKHAASTVSPNTPVAIDDNNPIGTYDVIEVPDIGNVQQITITLKVDNSDISGLEIIVYDPTNAAFVLHKGTGTGKVLSETWPVSAKLVSGDLAVWSGKNPKGKWRVRVIDTKFLNNGQDGALVSWSVNVLAAVSNQITSLGGFVAKGGFTVPTHGGAPFPCTALKLGAMYLDAGDKRLYYCDGDWRKLLIEPLCGNKVVNSDETCDDGNTIDGDGCTAKCQINVCGDGILWPGKEECDDGNKVDNDACSAQCKVNASPIACADGTAEQKFSDHMYGCDGNYTSLNIETACAKGWHPANPNEYFSYGGVTVKPTQLRWVDTAWDAQGKDTSIKNWQGYYDTSNSGGWNGLSKNNDCTWVSSTEQCSLAFVNHTYGQSYGCHCRGGVPTTTQRGVVCVKDSMAKPRL